MIYLSVSIQYWRVTDTLQRQIPPYARHRAVNINVCLKILLYSIFSKDVNKVCIFCIFKILYGRYFIVYFENIVKSIVPVTALADVINGMKITEHCQIVFIVRERPTINLLLLGETGTGKSTWINGFANYVSYETLAASEEAGGFFPIRAIFRVISSETFEEQIIATDKHVGDGDYPAGLSVTQEPITYSFTYGSLTINIIDTPGLNDTENIDPGRHEKDKQNVDDVLHFIGRFDKLHAICILLKPNQTRITESFKYCITEILRNLHKSASNNVIFIITNARSSDFKPADTFTTLRSFLSINKLDRIKLNNKTAYFFENDTLQHIAKCINGCHHDKQEHRTAEETWKKSAKSTIDMLTYIQGLAPHDVNNTQCIYNTRCLIRILSKVLLDVVKCITTNFELLESKKQEIKERELEIQNSPSKLVNELLRKVLSTEIQTVDYEELPHSNTVCKSPKCAELVRNELHFKQICCEDCKGFITLWTCKAFEGITKKRCKHCGCERSRHEWTATKTVLKQQLYLTIAKTVLAMFSPVMTH